MRLLKLITLIILSSVIMSGCASDAQIKTSSTKIETDQNDKSDSFKPSGGIEKRFSAVYDQTSEAPSQEALTASYELEEIIVKGIIPTNIFGFSEGVAFISYNNLRGLVNEQGELLLEPKELYGIVRPFVDGYSIIIKDENGKPSIYTMDKEGNETFVVDGFWAVFGDSNQPWQRTQVIDGRAIVKNAGSNSYQQSSYEFYSSNKYSLIDMEGNVLFFRENVIYLSNISCNRIIWLERYWDRSKEYYTITDSDGNVIRDNINEYSIERAYSDDILIIETKDAKAQSDLKYGIMDKDGNVVTEPEFEYLSDASEGLIIFKKYGYYGYIDYKGNVVIEPQFEVAGNFHEGLAAIKVDGLYGYIDYDGNIVIEPQYEYAESFQNGLAPVKINGYYCFIDKDNNVVITTDFSGNQEIIIHEGDFIEFLGKGIIDKDGVTVFLGYAYDYDGGNIIRSDVDSSGIKPHRIIKR